MKRDQVAKPYYFDRKVRSIKRKIIWGFLQKKLDVVLVSEFPKSGGSWYAKMLSEVLSVPFPRNNLPVKFEKSVLHGHVKYSERFHKPIYVIRDGRDVVVSAYFHFLFENEYNIPEFVNNNRKKLAFNDFDDIENNLPKFIEYLYLDYGTKIGHTTWSNFISDWSNKGALEIKYENLLLHPNEELVKSLDYLGKEIDNQLIIKVIENNKFKKKKNPNGISFARKGIAGDWKNNFNEESKKVFKDFSSKELIIMGYEQDNNW